ncbi:MAG: mevalonate kinase [Anaerolineales bacterium]
MPAFTAAAPAKIILFGEHAVVYGEPALAVPVTTLQARAVVSAQIGGARGEILIDAPDIGLSSLANELANDHPLRAAVAAAAGTNDLNQIPACRILITSTIPISSGLGSSAAVSAAVIRAFSAFLGKRLADDEVSDLTFQVEKIQHGAPSGIDNNVVVHQKPVYYQKGKTLEYLSIKEAFEILIADSGIPGSTLTAVESVRKKWLANQQDCEKLFSRIGEISRSAREIITRGDPRDLGPLMNENQECLRELGVSLPELDRLAESALEAGALGAKLSGGGLGGNLIALSDDQSHRIEGALLDAGAQSVLPTTIHS